MKYSMNLAILDEFGEDPILPALTEPNSIDADLKWFYWTFLVVLIVVPRIIALIILVSKAR